MKILLYNIGYGTGLNGSWKHYLLKFWRYVWAPKKIFKKIIELIDGESADVICILEIDEGSIRNRFRSQTNMLTNKTTRSFFSSNSKYGKKSLSQKIPIIRKQHDAIFSNESGEMIIHYFKNGAKKLIQEYVIKGLSIFAVHLALTNKETRQKQLEALAAITAQCPRDYIICGDFNIFKGLHEVEEFIKKNNLTLAQTEPSFPSIKPKKNLDLFITSPGIKIKQTGVIQSKLSDHLPVWIEIENE